MTISFETQDTLYQFFAKQHLDRDNLLAEDQWDAFVNDVQSDFAHEVTEIANALFQGYIADLQDWLMKSAQVNRRIQDFLRNLADEGTFRMRKKTGHPVCVASYGGEQRSFTLCSSPGRNYQKYVIGNLNQFVRSLPFDDPPRFSLYKIFEDLWPSLNPGWGTRRRKGKNWPLFTYNRGLL